MITRQKQQTSKSRDSGRSVKLEIFVKL